jgi:hypothetical protein
MRKVCFGFVWFIAFYLIICMVAGGIAGAAAGSEHTSVEAAQRAGAEAGAKIVHEYQGYMLALAAMLAAMGSIGGVLPGTRDRVVA